MTAMTYDSAPPLLQPPERAFQLAYFIYLELSSQQHSIFNTLHFSRYPSD
jgi:hypothetical protein